MEEVPPAQGALEPLGALSQRARLGHRARGLQCRRHRLGVLPPRPRALARLPLERRRHCRHLRPPPAICFALALWNGRDPILKERLFGLTGNEGNHGEDVKEYYFYLDSTPTHSYMKCLYKYPQADFPYAAAGARRTRRARRATPSSNCSTPGVFDENRYFDVFVEYAKAAPDDISDPHHGVVNRGPETATLHLLPTVWFRNTWSWGQPGPASPSWRRAAERHRTSTSRITASAGSTREGSRRTAVHRKRNQLRRRCGARRMPARM